MKKLVIVRYIGSNPNGEYCTVGKDYGYFINTKKQIKEGDFICIGCVTKLRDFDDVVNEDSRVVSVVHVKKVIDDYDHNVEKANDIIGGLRKAPIYKELLGKADLGGYFAELDKKRKIEELQQRIEVRFKEAEKEALYRKLAETDPEMKTLLEELDSLK